MRHAGSVLRARPPLAESYALRAELLDRIGAGPAVGSALTQARERFERLCTEYPNQPNYQFRLATLLALDARLAGAAPGTDCLMCHHQGGAGAPFTFAGTLYDAGGTRPLAGATIYVQDSAGNVATAIARGNGNFFTADGFVSYPAKAFVSLCPSVIEMVAPVDQLTIGRQPGHNGHHGGVEVAGQLLGVAQ